MLTVYINLSVLEVNTNFGQGYDDDSSFLRISSCKLWESYSFPTAKLLVSSYPLVLFLLKIRASEDANLSTKMLDPCLRGTVLRSTMARPMRYCLSVGKTQ